MTNPNHTDTSRSGDPVALMHEHPDHCGCEFEEYRHGAGCLTDDDIANGWIETRLYPADRIEALEAENKRLVTSNEQWQVDYNEVVLEKLELLAVLREMTPDYEMLVDQSWDDGAIWSWVEKAKGIAAKARAALGEKQ